MHLLEIVDFFFIFWLLSGFSLLYFDYCCFLCDLYIYLEIKWHILWGVWHIKRKVKPQKRGQLGGCLVLNIYRCVCVCVCACVFLIYIYLYVYKWIIPCFLYFFWGEGDLEGWDAAELFFSNKKWEELMSLENSKFPGVVGEKDNP